MRFSSSTCDICGKPIFGCYWKYDDIIVCSWCEHNGKKCELCRKPIIGYYYTSDNFVLCEVCYENAEICDSCGKPIIGSYKVFDDEYKICSSCYRRRTKYDVTLAEAREIVDHRDIDIGRHSIGQTSPHLCIMAFSNTINRLSGLLHLRSNSKLRYMSNSYYFCSREIKYQKNASLSPVEAIVKGVGNCAAKSALLASLLKCHSLVVNICSTDDHVFVVTYYPSAPPEFQMFNQNWKPDGTNWADWVGMDPSSNCIFGRLPKRDYARINVHSV